MIRSLVVHEDGTHEVRVIADEGRLVMDAESGQFSIESGDPVSAGTDPAAVAFFYDLAPYWWRPGEEAQEEGRQRCAHELARAEAVAKARGWWLDILPGPHADGEWVAVLYDSDGDSLGSLGGIDSDDADTVRVVLAQLAHEVTR